MGIGGVRAACVAIAGLLLVTVTAGCDSDSSSPKGPKVGGTATARGPVAWPAPEADQVAQLADAAEATLETHETLIHHAHTHLDVFVHGDHRVVPAGIGIVITDPAVRTFEELTGTSYGGIAGCDQPCISPLHTHDASGVVHTESATEEDRVLGQFFREWNVRLDDRCVGEFCAPGTSILVFVDGEEVPLASAADLPLTNGKEIAIVIGDLPDRIPSEGDFSAA